MKDDVDSGEDLLECRAIPDVQLVKLDILANVMKIRLLAGQQVINDDDALDVLLG